jgi:hypothetical protein
MAKKDFMNIMKEKTSDLRPSILSSEENIKQQVLILEELKALIPPLTTDELLQLEQNLLKYGVKDPLAIWETNSTLAQIDDLAKPVFILIDGHNRYQICQKHRIDYRINLMNFASLDEVKDYMINYQLGRRNLTAEQTSYLRGLRYLQQKSMRGGSKTTGEQQDVSALLAQEYGVSSRTIKRDGEFAMGLNKLSPSLKQEVLSGVEKLPKATINTIAKAEIDTPLQNIEEINSLLIQTQNNSIEDNSAIKTLQSEIKKIANSTLSKNECTIMLDKVNALITLWEQSDSVSL